MEIDLWTKTYNNDSIFNVGICSRLLHFHQWGCSSYGRAKMPLAGGLSSTKPADKTIEDIVKSTKASIQTKLGSTNVTVVNYKIQTVNGTNYFVKVKTDNGYAHLRIYKPFSGSPSLVSVQTGKTKDEEITYF
ncbi:hypothetical protein ACTFIY_007324 [Dictyostelium cf. discoideum]